MTAVEASRSGTSYGHGESSGLLGRTEPRLWTPPLRELTPATSYGFDVVDFSAELLGLPLDPWEEWLVIHAGELLPDGRPRFRKVLVIVARQNGKTHVLVVLSLYWIFIEARRLVLGTSTNLGYAKESWEKAVEIAEDTPELAEHVARIRRAAGEEALVTDERCRYKIAAANRRGGRSLTIERLILDELREHDSWDAWNAAYNAMNAVPDAQAFAITNQGDHSSLVLDSIRGDAIERVDGVDRMRVDPDPRLGVFEWSAPEGSEPDDPHAIAAANPNLGRRIDLDSLLSDARRAKRNGGEELASFQTEVLCMRVDNLDPAVDEAAWQRNRDPGTLDAVRPNVAAVLDVSRDEQHATLCVAGVLPDERVRVEAVRGWDDMGLMRRELPALIARIAPRRFGWFPNGPAAALNAELADRSKHGRRAWPPKGVEVAEITGETTAACMAFAQLVKAEQLAHSDDPLLNAHVTGAERSWRGDAWVFARRGAAHCDGAYAAAGAVQLARTLPTSVGKPRLVVTRNSSANPR